MLVARGPVEHDGGVDGHVVVDSTQRRRSRFRTQTSTEETVGVVVDAAGQLSAGDVLEADDGRRFAVELEATEAFVVSLPAEADATALVAAGHAVGNRHWELATRDARLYVPTDGERERRRAFLNEVLPEGSTVGVEQVEPTLFDDATPSGHGHGEHEHSHGGAHEAGQSHEAGHTHADGTHHSHAHEEGETLTLGGVRQAAGSEGGETDE